MGQRGTMPPNNISTLSSSCVRWANTNHLKIMLGKKIGFGSKKLTLSAKSESYQSIILRPIRSPSKLVCRAKLLIANHI